MAEPLCQYLSIGDVALALNAHSCSDLALPAGLNSFRTPPCKTDIELDLEWAEALVMRHGAPAFDSGAVWTLSRDGEGLSFDFSSPVLARNPYKRLYADADFRRAKLTLSRSALGRHNHVSALEYPADELLVTNYLAAHELGVEVHGCGLIDRECGSYLFLGHSGAGKSTTARLWKSLRNVEILSDDRIILRLHRGELWMYGTPWHGEAAFASPARAKLDRIFILAHGSRNHFAPLSRVKAVGELFARSFPPFHNAAGLERTVAFLDRASQIAGCYEFQFTPDNRAIESALGFHD